jgi:hypothetical protein
MAGERGPSDWSPLGTREANRAMYRSTRPVEYRRGRPDRDARICAADRVEGGRVVRGPGCRCPGDGAGRP